MTIRRRSILFGVILVSVVAVMLGVLEMLPQGPGVTKANFDRIEVGMTTEEVQAILGEQSGDFMGPDLVQVSQISQEGFR